MIISQLSRGEQLRHNVSSLLLMFLLLYLHLNYDYKVLFYQGWIDCTALCGNRRQHRSVQFADWIWYKIYWYQFTGQGTLYICYIANQKLHSHVDQISISDVVRVVFYTTQHKKKWSYTDFIDCYDRQRYQLLHNV